MAETLYEKALRLLGRPVSKAVDTDDPDARVGEEAAPTDKKLEAAGEEAAAGGQAAGGAEGGVPGDPGAGAGDGDGDEGAGAGAGDGDGDEGAGDDDGDEGEDMSDDDIRELRKAFGLTDFDSVADTKKDANIAGMLGQILAHIQKTDAFMQSLTKELVDLKSKHSSGSGDPELRVAMKSLDERVQGIQDMLGNMHKLAPAAGQPRAVSKAIPQQGAAATPKLTLNDVTKLALSGDISAAEAAKLTRQINHQTPA